MFSLIITIISIALVVALVAATMYYGGSALNQGTVKADAAGFVAGAQQISAALAINQTDGHGGPAALIAASSDIDYIKVLIANNYLATIPVVKVGAENANNELTTSDNVWVLSSDVYLNEKPNPATGGETMLQVYGDVLQARVANPDVCAKLQLDGKSGINRDGLYECDEEGKLFTFFISRHGSTD